MSPELTYLLIHGGVTVLILQQLNSINKRLGAGDSWFEILKKKCPILGGKKRCKDVE